MAGFPSLDDLKAHLNIEDSDSDDELLLMLDAASEVVESFVGSFDASAVAERVYVYSGTVLLSRAPSGPVTLTTPGGDPVTGFTVNSAARVIYDAPYGYSYLDAAYDAGDGNTPAAVTLAALIIAGHLFETQRGNSPSALALQQQNETTFGVTPSAGFAIPNRAKELLQPFVRSQGIA